MALDKRLGLTTAAKYFVGLDSWLAWLFRVGVLLCEISAKVLPCVANMLHKWGGTGWGNPPQRCWIVLGML